MKRRLLLVITAAAPLMLAQELKEFEVASIKPAAPGGHGLQIQIAPGGRFVAKNVSVKILIQQAYGVRDFQITGGPGWIGSERYDINAKGEEARTPEQLKPMLQALLADRFKLQIHRETKELPMYGLVVQKNGTKLQESKAGNGPGPRIRMGRGLIEGQGMSMAILANQLGQQLGRSVTDKTGLTGTYDIKLEWTPDESQGSGPRELGGEGGPPVDTAGPTIFTALQEQLGLKLDSQKGAVEILIVDRAEKATEN
jgi:bla regulator protein BlaR1